MLKLDRVIYSSFITPGYYGFIPQLWGKMVTRLIFGDVQRKYSITLPC
ncbi:MAG: hypothetical protein WDM90_19360 [Ferruginibacter sp.]